MSYIARREDLTQTEVAKLMGVSLRGEGMYVLPVLMMLLLVSNISHSFTFFISYDLFLSHSTGSFVSAPIIKCLPASIQEGQKVLLITMIDLTLARFLGS